MPAADWARMWATTPGTASHNCVDVAANRDVRSGEFIAGNFASYIDYWHKTHDLSKYDASKLYYVPLHPSGRLPFHPVALHVTIERTDTAPPLTLRYTTVDGAWGNGAPFYATSTVIPEAGRWRIMAEAGTNWGCFLMPL